MFLGFFKFVFLSFEKQRFRQGDVKKTLDGINRVGTPDRQVFSTPCRRNLSFLVHRRLKCKASRRVFFTPSHTKARFLIEKVLKN